MVFYMTNLSISLSNDLAKASSETAKKLGISTTAFIRRAVVHELENISSEFEKNNIIKSFDAMKKSSEYLIMSEELTNDLNSNLPEEEREWWKKKS